MTKKFLVFCLIFLGAIAAMPALAYFPGQGDLIKVSGNPAVYYVDSYGYRHLFPTEATFFSWYSGSWRDQSIQTISISEFNQLATGKNITARPGYALIRFENSKVMYAVLPGGRLCYATAHYNNYQYNRALVVPAGFQIDYDSSASCDITQYSDLPDGTLFRYVDSNDIWYVQNGQRRRVTSYGMTANNFRYESIIANVDWSMDYSEGAVIDGYDSDISSINSYLDDYGYANYNYYYYNNYRYCSENWTCGSWGSCLNGYQYRNCNDLNNCGTTNSKPVTGQSCYSYNYLCRENWSCGSWSSCAYGSQYRTCWDLNSCGTTASKPATSQSCYSCQENWTCTNWGTCQSSGLANGWQFRTCTDSNSCGTYKNQPTTSQVCNTCQTNWSCTGWTTCRNSMQTRNCIDLNNCNSTSNKPTTSQSCY